MTREEQKQIADFVRSLVHEIITESGIDKNAHTNAVLRDVADGIEKMDTEPCEDAISRAAAIKAMDDLEQEDIERYSCSIPEGFDGKRAIEALQKLPSVTPTCSEKPNNCTACIIDGTDACSRGAGRAVDGRACEDFVGESEGKE